MPLADWSLLKVSDYQSCHAFPMALAGRGQEFCRAILQKLSYNPVDIARRESDESAAGAAE
jgi:hypothetical protein